MIGSDPQYTIALMFDRHLKFALEHRDDEAALSALARTAVGESREDEALLLLRSAAERQNTPRLWQWTGLLQRGLDDHEQALASFQNAATLAPADLSIAHGQARIALEAGVPSTALFEKAMRLSPGDPDVLLGYVASLLADGDAERAESTLDYAISGAPLWADGHTQLAQLRSIIGKKEDATVSLERAIQLHPRHEGLWFALFHLLQQAQQFPALDEAIGRARRTLGDNDTLLRYEAVAAAEGGDVARADRLLASMGQQVRHSVAIWEIRHLLRNGRLMEASTLVDAALPTDLAADIWPYAAVVWRLTGDRRWAWLEGDLERMVSVIDINSQLPRFGDLKDTLRRLHAGKGEFLDQSVRGGSQTDGPLFTRIDPPIRALRNAVVSAVERYVANLPPPDPAHPLLGARRDRRTSFSGSWSVLLRGGGHHVNHVHPQGWISSALYIQLPERAIDEPENAGWLTLGEPQTELNVDLPVFREIEPKPGKLVLFPSYMWHGTRPFREGERLTVAFDVKRPI